MKEINFGKNLKNLRAEKDMSQKQLAKKIAVDQRTVSAWENGVCEPSYHMLAVLCELFDVSFDDILT